MLLKFPKKKIILDCFTHNASIHKLFPIAPAIRHSPEWYKKIPQTATIIDEHGIELPQATFKRCDGFSRLFNVGWVLPLWCDTKIETDEDGSWRFRVSDTVDKSIPHIVAHSEEQLGNNFPNYTHIKMHVPWVIKEKTGVYFHYSQNTWGIKEHWDYLTVVPGLINFKNQGAANINMFLKRGSSIMLEHNTPLVHCIPLSEAKLEIKNHLVSEQEYNHLHQPSSFNFAFVGNYKKMLQMEERSNCPNRSRHK